jgi:uncharacterized protein YfdQ (DUF2303 family)
MIDETAIKAISALTRNGISVTELPQGGVGIMKPDGNVQVFPPLDPILTHVKQVVKAFDAESFAAYVNRFKLQQLHKIEGEETAQQRPVTTLFADPNKFQLRGVIDYHADMQPGRCAHSVHFDVPFSEQWNRWRSIDGVPMGQGAFAEFLEENCQDCVEPASAVFLDLVTNLQSKKKVTFESGVRLQDGANQLVFSEEIETKGRGTMMVPSDFSIGVPIFLNGEAYKVRALLRYRISEGAVVFTVKLHRRTFLEQTAFADVCNWVEDKAQLPILNAWA